MTLRTLPKSLLLAFFAVFTFSALDLVGQPPTRTDPYTLLDAVMVITTLIVPALLAYLIGRDDASFVDPTKAQHDAALATALREACELYEAQGRDVERCDVRIGVLLDRTRELLRPIR